MQACALRAERADRRVALRGHLWPLPAQGAPSTVAAGRRTVPGPVPRVPPASTSHPPRVRAEKLSPLSRGAGTDSQGRMDHRTQGYGPMVNAWLPERSLRNNETDPRPAGILGTSRLGIRLWPKPSGDAWHLRAAAGPAAVQGRRLGFCLIGTGLGGSNLPGHHCLGPLSRIGVRQRGCEKEVT
jgi:hypothetical protein